MELNVEQIIKALECCEKEEKSCHSCPLTRDYSPCSKTMARNALALIRELTEENESLKDMNDALANGFETVKADIEQKMVDKVVDKVVAKARKQAFLVGDNQYILISELEEIAKGVIK